MQFNKNVILKMIMYFVFIATSVVFIALYWNNEINFETRTVLMSIGSSLIGAVSLAIFLDLIARIKVINEKKIILKDAVNTSRELINQLDALCDELRKESIFDFQFKDEIEFSKKSTKLYLKLTDERNEECDKKAEDMYYTIQKCIIDTFLIDACKNAMFTFKKIIDNENMLLISGYISKEEIKNINAANTKINFFIGNFNKNNSLLLLTNGLNFRKHLDLIISQNNN